VPISACAPQIFRPREIIDRFPLARLTRFSKIIVREESTVVVALKPMVEMDLTEVGRNQFLAEFVRLAAEEGNL
jgi:hypothetical protein